MQWCDDADQLAVPSGNRDRISDELEQKRPFLSKTVNMQAAVQSKNNIFQVKKDISRCINLQNTSTFKPTS